MAQTFSSIGQLDRHLSNESVMTTGAAPAAVLHKNLHKVIIHDHAKKILGRLIIVGDIHGCPEQLDQLLQHLNFVQGIDQLVLAGDIVNKGPDSITAVEKAMEYNALSVLGNHDLTLLEIHTKIKSGEIKPFEKKDAKDPFVRLVREMPDSCVRYLSNLPHVIRFAQYNVTVLHAGINPSIPLHAQSIQDLTHLRRLAPDPENPGKYVANKKGTLWAKLYSGPETIIFGHDARTGLQLEPKAIGLDTGCVYGGMLTAVIFPGAKIIQVAGLPMKKQIGDDDAEDDNNTSTPPIRSPQSMPTPPQFEQQDSLGAAFPNVPNVQQLFDKARKGNAQSPPPGYLQPSSSPLTDPHQHDSSNNGSSSSSVTLKGPPPIVPSVSIPLRRSAMAAAVAATPTMVPPPAPFSPAAPPPVSTTPPPASPVSPVPQQQSLTSSSSSENVFVELVSLLSLVNSSCASGFLVLAKSAHYSTKMSQLLSPSSGETETLKRNLWTTVLAVFAVEAPKKAADEASEMIMIIVDILDARPKAATPEIVEKLRNCAKALEAAGLLQKNVLKVFKMSL